MRARAIRLLVLWVLLVATAALADAGDPLPSWRNGEAKSAIIEFVREVTNPASGSFVPAEERIATFDNDGTLWVEQPVYPQFGFVAQRVEQLAPRHPEWKTRQPFQSVLESDPELHPLAKDDLLTLINATHAGMTTTELRHLVRDFLAAAKHPRFDVLHTELIYQPMLEVLRFLRANGFKTYIVTAGGMEFVRAFAEPVYGIPPEQVIGSRLGTRFVVEDGKAMIVQTPETEFINNGPAKAVAIATTIGRRPIFAFGNSDGDIEMLEFTDSGEGRRLAMLVHHDDAFREYAYACDDGPGRLCEGFRRAERRGWVLVSIEKDWSRVFPFPNAVSKCGND